MVIINTIVDYREYHMVLSVVYSLLCYALRNLLPKGSNIPPKLLPNVTNKVASTISQVKVLYRAK